MTDSAKLYADRGAGNELLPAEEVVGAALPVALFVDPYDSATRTIGAAFGLRPPMGSGLAASGVTFTPAGNISSTNVQAALVELDSEKATPAQITAALSGYLTASVAASTYATISGLSGKQASNANLTALSGLTGASGKIAAFTGAGAMALVSYGTSGNNTLVQTDGTGKLPALDGSQLTNLPGGGGVSLSSATPLVDGTASAGSAGTAARGDHVHPTDTSRQAADATLTALAGVTTAADQLIYATGADAFATTALPSQARTFLAATTVTAQRTALSAAASGANSDITSLTGLTTALSIGQGGTGAATAAAARTGLGLDPASVTTLAAGTDNIAPATALSLANLAAPLTVTYAATLALDLNTRKDFDITLTGNLTLSNFANLKPGDRGRITLNQDATGGRTLAVGSYFVLFGGGTMDTGASKTTVLSYDVVSATKIIYTLLKV